MSAPSATKPHLTVMVGLPRSGKSTWARATGYPMVNPDSIRLAIHGQAFNPDAEPMVWTLAIYMVRALFLAGHTQVILDATNVTRQRRQQWRSANWTTGFVFVDTPVTTCKERALANNQTDLLPVIDRMFRDFEPLTTPEGFAVIHG